MDHINKVWCTMLSFVPPMLQWAGMRSEFKDGESPFCPCANGRTKNTDYLDRFWFLSLSLSLSLSPTLLVCICLLSRWLLILYLLVVEIPEFWFHSGTPILPLFLSSSCQSLTGKWSATGVAVLAFSLCGTRPSLLRVPVSGSSCGFLQTHFASGGSACRYSWMPRRPRNQLSTSFRASAVSPAWFSNKKLCAWCQDVCPPAEVQGMADSINIYNYI